MAPLVSSQDMFPPHSLESLPEERKGANLKDLRKVHRKDCAPVFSERQSRCGLDLAPTCLLEYFRSADPGQDGRVYSVGLEHCGSVWSCPVCSHRICAHRGEELQNAIDTHRANGGDVYLLTLTLPHHAGHRLKDVHQALAESFRYLKAGAPWKRQEKRLGIEGTVRGSEATHGPNGWHPHLHAVVFVRSEWEEEEAEAFLLWVRERWDRVVESWYFDGRGDPEEGPALKRRPLNKPLPSGHVPAFGRTNRDHGVTLIKARKAGAYVAKMGLGREAATMTVKEAGGGHRTPLQILRDYADHRRDRDKRLWLEWCKTMKGRQHLTWSAGLRDRLALGPEQLELQLAQDPGEEEDRYICALEPNLAARLGEECGGMDELSESLASYLEEFGTTLLEETLTKILGDPRGRVVVDPEERVYWWCPWTDKEPWGWPKMGGLVNLSEKAKRQLGNAEEAASRAPGASRLVQDAPQG